MQLKVIAVETLNSTNKSSPPLSSHSFCPLKLSTASATSAASSLAKFTGDAFQTVLILKCSPSCKQEIKAFIVHDLAPDNQ